MSRPALMAVPVIATFLTGCASTDPASTDSAARFLVAPGKYAIYNCAQIKEQSKTKAAREQELEGLMARASASSGGRLVNAVAYRPEYVTLRGELMDLRQAAADKKCDFVPGEPALQPASGRAIR
jgi:hypothetical protein